MTRLRPRIRALIGRLKSGEGGDVLADAGETVELWLTSGLLPIPGRLRPPVHRLGSLIGGVARASRPAPRDVPPPPEADRRSSETGNLPETVGAHAAAAGHRAPVGASASTEPAAPASPPERPTSAPEAERQRQAVAKDRPSNDGFEKENRSKSDRAGSEPGRSNSKKKPSPSATRGKKAGGRSNQGAETAASKTRRGGKKPASKTSKASVSKTGAKARKASKSSPTDRSKNPIGKDRTKRPSARQGRRAGRGDGGT